MPERGQVCVKADDTVLKRSDTMPEDFDVGRQAESAAPAFVGAHNTASGPEATPQ